MVKPITLYSAAAGLNTVLDPQRLLQGTQDNPGLIELSQAMNVSIDDRGLVELRTGCTSMDSNSYHSLFCDGGDCFVVHERTNDAAIMQVVSLSPLTLVGVRDGLTKGRRMGWAQNNTDTFYGNGIQFGYIRGGASFAWPAGNYTGPDDDRQFSSAPAPEHIAFLPGGMVAIAVGQAVYLNHAPYQYGLFSLRSGYIGFQSNVIMMAPVKAGIFISDGEKTWFFRKAEGWYKFRQEQVANYPALPWSLATEVVPLADIGIDAPGHCRIWGSQKGLCAGLDDGTMVNLTQTAVPYPVGVTSGACLVLGDKKIIHTSA